jgi:hypothetical protein
MKNPSQSHPRAKWFARLLIVPALLLAGYAGMELAPLVHTTTSNAGLHTLLVDTCTSGYTHC